MRSPNSKPPHDISASAQQGDSSPALDVQAQAYLQWLRTQRKYSAHTTENYALDLLQLQSFASNATPSFSSKTKQLPATLTRSFEPIDWPNATEHMIRRAVAQLNAQGRAPRSIARMLSCWRGFFDYLAQQKVMCTNPARDVRAPKAAKLLPKALSTDQAVALMEHAQQDHAQASAVEAQSTQDPAVLHRDAAILELLYSSGLRLSELIGLDHVHTQRTGYVSTGRLDLQALEVTVQGKGGKTRTVPVGEHAAQALAQWLQVRALLAHPDEPALFVGTRGQRISASVVQALVRKAGQRAGLPTQMHPHMLRHSFASHVLQSSGDLRAVQELLGHANISTTQVYTQLDFQHLAKVYDAAHPRAKKAPSKRQK